MLRLIPIVTSSTRQPTEAWTAAPGQVAPATHGRALLATPRHDVALAAGLVLLVGLLRVAWLALQGDARLITMVPDDAFYYIVLAQNFAETGRWTFDGVAPATGFHLLWGYLLAGVQALFGAPGWRSLFLVGAAA